MLKNDIYGDGYSEYVKSIANFKSLSLNEEKENFLLYKTTGDEKYRNRIIESNLKYVVKVANQYKQCGISMVHLISEGNEGLFYAIDKFDYEKANVKIISYATHWIRYRISSAIADINKQNIELNESCNNITKFTSETEYTNHYENHPLLDYEPYQKDEYIKITEQLTACLTERELNIIKTIFGVDTKQKSIKEISSEMVLSQERVSQIRDKAILKMQSVALINNIVYNTDNF